MNRVANIDFHDGSRLNLAHEATYLGNNLNHTVDLRKEVIQRIQETKRTWNRLSLFWKDPTTNKKWQLLIYDAVIKSKLLYSIEPIHLTQSLRKKVDSFHLRGLRRILKLPTTFIDRRNTNMRVYELASEMAFPNQPTKRIKPFSQELDERRVKLAGHILRAQASDPLRQVSYQAGSGDPIQIGKRRVGRPRQQWLYRTNEAIHNMISHTDYDGDPVQNSFILRAAQQRIYRMSPCQAPKHLFCVAMEQRDAWLKKKRKT